MRFRGFVMASVLWCAACEEADSPDGGGGGGGGETTGSSAQGPGVGATGTAASGTSTGSGGAPSFEGLSLVDGGGTAVLGSTDLAIAPDGTLFVTWVDTANGVEDVLLARSTDGGATFGAPIQVDDGPTDPIVSMARRPYVATDGVRVAVTFIDETLSVRLYVADASTLAFGPPIDLGTDITTMGRDFPKAVFRSDGSIVVAWHGYPPGGGRIFVSRESAGFASESATDGAPGVPCECCPIDLRETEDGSLFLAFRNNENDTRDMWLASAPAGGAFSSWAPISTSEGMIPACPMQGPRLGQTGASSYLAVWSNRGSQDTGAVYLATSTNGGASWSGGAAIPGFVGDDPSVALGDAVYVTAITGNGESAMITSADGGATWGSPVALQSPDGWLVVPQAEAEGGVVALAAISEAGTVWLRRME